MISQQFALRRKLMVQAGLPPRKGTLDEYTWEEISIISQAGRAQSYFEIGDTKAVHIKGTIGIDTFDATYYVYIIDFDHAGATNTIDFGTFKTADGVDVCLMSESESVGADGIKKFKMRFSETTNSGGWQSCDMRESILGSKSVSSPTAKTLMAALPTELRAVMKPITVYTDNRGGGTTNKAYITATEDYLPLLAEYEITGETQRANPYEADNQRRYKYFAYGYSAIKYKSKPSMDGGYGDAADWWTRSPYKASATTYTDIDNNGDTSSISLDNATSVYGIAPIFRV